MMKELFRINVTFEAESECRLHNSETVLASEGLLIHGLTKEVKMVDSDSCLTAVLVNS